MLRAAFSLLLAIGTAYCVDSSPPATSTRPAPPTAVALPAASAGATAATWLDRPLENWNRAGGPVPAAPAPHETRDTVVARCRLAPLPSTTAAGVVTNAGWIPFLPGGRPLASGDVEVIGGMIGADGMCRPVAYNLFVFVAGRFAGTLSPVVMTSREDSASGTVTMVADGLAAEFLRYSERDPLCCPSGRVNVRYRIDRRGAPIVTPVAVDAALEK